MNEKSLSHKITFKDKIINTIKDKYKNKLEDYIFEEDFEKIKLGRNIYYVNLHLNTIRNGTVMKLHKNKFNRIYKITLKNLFENYIWSIKTTKYYIFREENYYQNKSSLRSMIESYLETINSEKTSSDIKA